MLGVAVYAAEVHSTPTEITFVIPYAAGGAADFIGRQLALEITSNGHFDVSVTNKPGAGGTIGSLAVSKSKPDGRTWVICGLGSHVVGPLMRDVGYDPERDFSIASIVGGPPSALIVSNESSFRTFVELRDKKLTWASPGAGTHGHLVGTLLSRQNNLVSNHIPFKGGAAAVQSVMGNHVQAAVATITALSGASDSDLFRVLAVSSKSRSKLLPNTPTFEELGAPQLTSLTWFGVCGPKHAPAQALIDLGASIQNALKGAKLNNQFAQRGVEVLDLSPSESLRFLQTERDRWSPLVARPNN